MKWPQLRTSRSFWNQRPSPQSTHSDLGPRLDPPGHCHHQTRRPHAWGPSGLRVLPCPTFAVLLVVGSCLQASREARWDPCLGASCPQELWGRCVQGGARSAGQVGGPMASRVKVMERGYRLGRLGECPDYVAPGGASPGAAASKFDRRQLRSSR